MVTGHGLCVDRPCGVAMIAAVRIQVAEDTTLSGSAGRLQAIEAVTAYRPMAEPLTVSTLSATEFFGTSVFNKNVMKARLPKPVFKSLLKTIDRGRFWTRRSRTPSLLP